MQHTRYHIYTYIAQFYVGVTHSLGFTRKVRAFWTRVRLKWQKAVKANAIKNAAKQCVYPVQ